MRHKQLLLSSLLVLGSSFGEAVGRREPRGLAVRVESSAISSFPALSSGSAVSSSLPPLSSSDSSQLASSVNSPSPTTPSSASNTAGGGGSNKNSTTSTTTSSSPHATIPDGLASKTSSTEPTPNPANNSTSGDDVSIEELPLPPQITPALSIAGVFLILTGIAYALIGVKNKWIHVFLSTAYLASLSVLVLIIYVVNPPVSNALQGAYLVGVFMSGIIFGGGALIFKEVTEGLGCLLGGFCLSMWFLTLKPGGLITNTSGKGIFIGVFSVICWALSFSHYTRAYGLIGSTSLSGSTALVLGIDCFSRGGLKEFWVYLWALNDKLFPLNTDTYPITRGTRVETIAIILGTVIGVISQVRLWKIVENKQKQRTAAQAEDERRRDAVEEALGRHLERQNDRDRPEWEKRYGNRLEAKRNTILWTEAHGENKRFSSASTTEVGSTNNSDDSLEMTTMPSGISKTASYSSRSKRHSSVAVHTIQEVEEEDHDLKGTRMSNRDSVFGDTKPGELLPQLTASYEKFSFDQSAISPCLEQGGVTQTPLGESISQIDAIQSLKPQSSKPTSRKTASRLQQGEEEARTRKRTSILTLKDLKRQSIQSLGSKSPRSPSTDGGRSPNAAQFGESQEALVIPTASIGTHSRTSSIAATMDEENEKLDMPSLDPDSADSTQSNRPPQIVISPVHVMSFDDQIKAGLPPSPSGLSDQFDADPEELVRRSTSKTNAKADCGEEDPKSSVAASQASSSEILTRDALNRLPSQMSDVVLSYRTNEWAKHIATAEAPICEEPEPILEDSAEPPTHLADPSSSTQAEPPTTETIAKPPPLPSPVVSVAPSEKGVKVNPEAQPEQSRSRPTSDIVEVVGLAVPTNSASTVPSRSPSQVSDAPRRSFTDPT